MNRSSVFAVVISLSFLLSVLASSGSIVLSSGEMEGHSDFLIRALSDKGIVITEEESGEFVNLAHHAALEIYPNNRSEYASFRDSLLQNLVQVRGHDVVIVYSSGGWGKTPMDEALEREGWGEIVTDIMSKLTEWERDPQIIEHMRTGETVAEKVDEIKETLAEYPFKSQVLAKKIEFLTQVNPHTMFIITGVSQGAAYNNAVMRLLASNKLVYSIEIAKPFYSQDFEGERMLFIKNDDICPDSVVEGNITQLATAFVSGLFKWTMGGCSDGLGGYIQPSGHDYEGALVVVKAQIADFLWENFGEGN